MKRNRINREELTVSSLATIYGCCGYFSACSDADLMSLSMEGTSKFLDWIGWERTNVCNIVKNFITWVRPEPNISGNRSVGYLANACGDSNGVGWGSCDFTLTDWALLRRHGPVRNATRNDVIYCERQPRYRLDGTPITDDAEYDMALVMEVITQDLKRMLIDGNALVDGQFDGLERLVKNGYTNSKGVSCSSMDSLVVDWNGNDMDGGNGITINGNAIANTFDMVEVLLAVVRRIMDRIQLAPQLAKESMNVGDIVIVAPTHLIRCLLDAYTCWSVCPGQQYREANLNTYEARTFRNNLNGGMFGSGKIFLDQMEIPLIPYNWGLIKTPTLSDMYVLTGSVGSVKAISGQYNDLATTPSGYPEAGYTSTDG
ncbi:hypothetical protein MUP59_10215, partial [Candidatus Bathyarchaeota archaeon]|nr:hypothetical protein [Candidatus Bathyarchaeota archaeon]